MSELLPCPFCGAKAEEDFYQKSNRIACSEPGCPARTTWLYERQSEAIAAWNRRSRPSYSAPYEGDSRMSTEDR